MTGLILCGLLAAPTKLDTILDSKDLKKAIVGAVILDADGRELYARNADLRLIPASNQKILSCAYAIGVLGPDATLKTKIWKRPDGILVHAQGDPSLTTAILKNAASKLALPDGSFVHVFQDFRVGHPYSWEWDDLPFTYAAPVTALSVDRGAWTLQSDKGKVIDPSLAVGVTVHRGRVTGRVGVSYDPSAARVVVNGSLSNDAAQLGRFSLPDPDLTAARLLGGRFKEWQESLPDSPPDLIIESPPIRTLIKDCLEPSDNLYAEHLLLTAARGEGELGDNPYAVANERMSRFFQNKVGLMPEDLRPTDGSGLSRQNLVTPRAIAQILKWTDSQAWSGDYRAALAEPGEGTLRRRMETVKFAGKTGTINAVSTLSGILNPGSPQRRYVSLMFNSAIVSSAKLRTLQDEFMKVAQDWQFDEHT